MKLITWLMKDQIIMTFFHNLPNYGYISEVNLEYSKGLHNLDNTYRYAPEKICMVDTNN